MTDTIRDLLISLASHMAYMQGQLEARHELDDPEDYYWYRESVLLRQKVTDALTDEPAVPEGREPVAVVGEPSDEEIMELMPQQMHEDLADAVRAMAEREGINSTAAKGVMRIMLNRHVVDLARAVLARWGNPAPVPPADGEVAKLVQHLHHAAEVDGWNGASPEWCQSMLRAAELLQRQVMVPVSVSDALIKAECALSDIAEGEPMTDEGDPLQWAERRCADTLAIIRPTMRQHKIRTSEWPPLPPPTDKEPTRLRNCPTHGQQPPWAWGCPECVRQLREELAALQQRHPAPVPVSERLPGPEDCAPWPGEPNAGRWCWMASCVDNGWAWEQRTLGFLASFPQDFTHWLPAHALPLPGQETK